MKIKSNRYGLIEYRKEDVIYFDGGIPGFEDLKQYVLRHVDEERIFYTLHSIEDPEVALAITNPFNYVKEYEFEIDDSEIHKLGVDSVEDIQVFSVITLNTKKENVTINLKAPIVIGNASGKQLVLDKYDYPLRYKIFKEEQDACN